MIAGWIETLRTRLERRPVRRIERLSKRSAVPRHQRRDTLYLVGNPEQWLIFQCPCQRGHDIALTVGSNGSWTLRGHRRKPTIHPSVNSLADDRRCHFWLTAGRVRWCADSDRPDTGRRTAR